MPAYLSRTPGWQRVLVVSVLLAVAFGGYVRFADQNDVFCQSPDEMSEVMPGIRLHALPLTNVGAPVRYNFIQSMFYSQHGLGDVSFYYLASGTLSLLHIPVSERSLYAAGGATNLALALAGGLLSAYILGSTAAGWIFSLFVLVSPFYVFVSKTGWARLTWTPLLLLCLFLCQWAALRRRGIVWPLMFCGVGAFVALTDSFVILPVVGVVGWLAVDGPDRFRRLVRDRVFIAGCVAIALALGVDLLVGLVARARGTDLTLFAYVFARGRVGSLLPSLRVLSAWTQCIDYYLPFGGAWVIVFVAFGLAAAEGFRGRPVGFVAAWWLLASFGILRYAAAIDTMSVGTAPGFLNAYQLAVPSLLLVAWLLASIGEGRFLVGRWLWPATRGALVCAVTMTLALFMARRAYGVAFTVPEGPDLRPFRTTKFTDMSLSDCRTVKAAAFYVRSHQTALPYVFHLSSNVYLGHVGEFYYGLSYSRSSRPEDPNHLLDFGLHQFFRQNAPEAFYRPYGVRSFDYYVEFPDEWSPVGTDRAFASKAVGRLLAEGAHVVCTIWDRGRQIGRILSFHDEPHVDLEYGKAAAGWDKAFGRAGTLLQQPLAGSSYHFGYNWRSPE
jgi:hypothetical protein